METTITALAWIGLTVVTALSAATLFIWAMWAWENTLEYGTRMLGMMHATMYYWRFFLSSKTAQHEAAGKVLWARFYHLKNAMPEIAKAFEHQQEIHKPEADNE